MTGTIEQRIEETPADGELHTSTMPTRVRLPDTRTSVTHKFSIDGHKGYIIVGLYEDGQPGELFIKMAKEGSTMSGFVDTIGILASLALQYGVPVDALARKLENMRFEPSGWTKNAEIRHAHSIVDYICRWIGREFAGEYKQEHDSRATVEHSGKDQIADRGIEK